MTLQARVMVNVQHGQTRASEHDEQEDLGLPHPSHKGPNEGQIREVVGRVAFLPLLAEPLMAVVVQKKSSPKVRLIRSWDRALKQNKLCLLPCYHYSKSMITCRARPSGGRAVLCAMADSFHLWIPW